MSPQTHVHVNVCSGFVISKTGGNQDALCASQLPITGTKYLRKSTLREKRFVLSRSFRGLVHGCLVLKKSIETGHIYMVEEAGSPQVAGK